MSSLTSLLSRLRTNGILLRELTATSPRKVGFPYELSEGHNLSNSVCLDKLQSSKRAVAADSQNGEVKQFFVDGKPFIMLAGELHNSSASSTEYMQPIWERLAALHLNTVIGTASWELVEPEEGKFDFSLVDAQ